MLKLPFLLAALTLSLSAQGLFKVSAIGNSQSLLQPGLSAGKVKTIAPGAGDAGVGPGKISNNVNLHTGQPFYSIPLGGITARTVSYPIVLTYSGNTKSVVDQDNERAPTSWVGLGFNLTTPFVATNHKGTYTSSDDVIFCNLGPYGGGQILLDSAGTKYYVSSNPYIRVAYDTATSGEYAGQFTKWVFTFPDGKKMLFGQEANAQRYVQYTNGLIKASLNSNVAAKKFVYRWDLRSFYDTIPNRPPKNILTFEYDHILDSAATGKPYVREGYIKKIKWVEGAQEVESYEFKTAAKGSNEYAGYFSSEPKDDQRLYETRRLDTLKCYKEGTLTHFQKFDWTAQKKGLLSKIKLFHPHPFTGTPVQDSGWTFSYDSERFFLLSTITSPSSRKDSLEYYHYQFWATDGDQDAGNQVMLRADNTTEVPLPSDTADISDWKTEATCDERFCYLAAWDLDDEYLSGDPVAGSQFTRQKMYVEIRRNIGNYFDTRTMDGSDLVTARFEVMDPWTSAEKLKFIPTGNYVLLVNELAGTLLVYEYDGVRWVEQTPFSGDSRFSNGSFGSGIKVYAAPSYFLVQKTSSPYEVIVALRKADKWTSLNRNTSSCDFDNKGSYGEDIRTQPPSSRCLEWDTDNLIVSAMPSLFTVVHRGKSVLNVYALKKETGSFEEISSRIGLITDPTGAQVSGKRMNWVNNIDNVTPSSDYFLVSSYNGSQTKGLHGLYFDGDSLRVIYEFHSDTYPIGGKVFAYPSSDYFILGTPGIFSSNYTLDFMQKRLGSGGQIRFEYSGTIRNDFDPAWKLQVRTHPAAISVEYYASDTSYALRPRWQASANYHAYLYQVHRAFTFGFREKTSQLSLYSHNMFNTSFSGSDNMLVATHAMTPSETRCSENPETGPCTVKYYTARFHPDDTGQFITGKNFIAYNSSWKSLKQAQIVMSPAARLGAWVTLDTTGSSKRIRYRQFQYDGRGFTAPDSQFVVDRIISQSNLSNLDRDRVVHQFYYTPFSLAISEFNSNLLMPQFEVTDLARVKTDLTELGAERTFFNVDAQANPLSGKSGALVGSEKYSRIMAANGDTTLYLKAVSNPHRNPTWPKAMYLPRLKDTYTQSVARNQGRMTDTAHFLNYSDTNGLPHYTLTTSGTAKVLLSQSWFDTLGFAKQSATYRLSSKPSTSYLDTANPTPPYSYSSLIAASKVRYHGYYLQEDSLWREQDQSLTNADLRAGTTPDFRLDEGWLPGSKIIERDTANFFQVLESKAVKSKAAGALGETYTSVFYEGLRSNPVAVVGNSKLANCAILMGENGNAGLSGLDYRGKWENPGTSFTTVQAHTGRYSLRVVDNHGPTINLWLKDVRTLKYGFRVSAWVLSKNDSVKMAVERRQYNGDFVDVRWGSPVTGNPTKQGVWQRWEANLTYSQLTANSLFDANNDYLRIWIGTGSTVGNSNRIIYVDDIVCLPSQATFSLTTYDPRGPVTSVTGPEHRPTFFDIGFTGRVIAARDDKHRILSQGAFHRMGEN